MYYKLLFEDILVGKFALLALCFLDSCLAFKRGYLAVLILGKLLFSDSCADLKQSQNPHRCKNIMHQLTKLGLTNSGFSKTVGPPNAPSNILITDMENRGPISTSDISLLSIAVKPGVFCGFFSIIYMEYSLNIHRSQRQCCSNIFFTWQFLNQMRLSTMEKDKTWSMKGLDRRVPFGTLKICESNSFKSCQCGSVSNVLSNDKMCREPFKQLPVIFSSSMVCTLMIQHHRRSHSHSVGTYSFEHVTLQKVRWEFLPTTCRDPVACALRKRYSCCSC